MRITCQQVHSDGTINGPQGFYTIGNATMDGFSLSGSGTQDEPYAGNSENTADGTPSDTVIASGPGTFYLKSSVSSRDRRS